MQKPFLRVFSAVEARNLLQKFEPLGWEIVPLEDAGLRVVTESVRTPEAMPPFDRSTMDGYAVRCSDTFGASESAPALLTLVGETAMGEIPVNPLAAGQAVRIWTGGALPKGSDAVVMLEHVEEPGLDAIEILRAVAPFDNVIRRGEDFKAGEVLLRAGHRLRSQDLGLLAAMGCSAVKVFKKVRAALISSGDEIVPVDRIPPPGCVRDVNRYTLTAAMTEAHCTPLWQGIAPDSLKDLTNLIDAGMKSSDMTIVSGGSSMGSRDLVIEAIGHHEDSEILLHGVSISPGKPLIIARVGSHPIVGLPGHPSSALVCFEQFVVPLLRVLEGEPSARPFLTPSLTATLGRNVPSKEGRLDFVRVRLQATDGTLVAQPVIGKSGAISGMVKADGYIQIGEDCEGLYKGDHVIVSLSSRTVEEHIETQHISRHEVPWGRSGTIFEPSAPEKLSRI